MLSLKDIKKEKDFVNYILESGDKLSKIGGKELTDSQKESMIGVGATSLEDD
jgi:hypothetical protein